MIVHSLHFVGDAAAHALSSVPLNAKWVQLLAPSTNASDCRVGGAEVDSTTGFPLVKGSAQLLPSIAEISAYYDLSSIKYYLAASDVLEVLYGY